MRLMRAVASTDLPSNSVTVAPTVEPQHARQIAMIFVGEDDDSSANFAGSTNRRAI